EHGIRLCHLARSSIAWKRSVGRSPDLASTPGTHVTKRPTRGPVPISGPSTPPGPGDTTPRIMEETGARSHTGPGDRGPGSGPTKKVTGGRYGPGRCIPGTRRDGGDAEQERTVEPKSDGMAAVVVALRDSDGWVRFQGVRSGTQP